MKAPPKIVGTYALILREYSSNPQEDDNAADNNANYNKAPERPRKRQAVQLLFDNKEFPVIPVSTTPTQATQVTPSTVTQVAHTQISDFDAKLNAIEHYTDANNDESIRLHGSNNDVQYEPCDGKPWQISYGHAKPTSLSRTSTQSPNPDYPEPSRGFSK
jgi:hypothetical protein